MFMGIQVIIQVSVSGDRITSIFFSHEWPWNGIGGRGPTTRSLGDENQPWSKKTLRLIGMILQVGLKSWKLHETACPKNHWILHGRGVCMHLYFGEEKRSSR